MNYFCDTNRHLVCIPYSEDNLHAMAKDLKLPRAWFHKDHYDIPKRRISEITNKCTVISTREIVKIVRR